MDILDRLGILPLQPSSPLFNGLLNETLTRGRLASGYRGDYFRMGLGWAEVFVHVQHTPEAAPDEPLNVTGFSTHALTSDIWCLSCTGRTVPTMDGDELACCALFQPAGDLSRPAIPIHVVRHDIVARMEKGDALFLQVAAFPAVVRYFEAGTDAEGKRTVPDAPLDGIRPLGDDTVRVTARVEAVEKRFATPLSGKPVEYLETHVATPFGPLCLCHFEGMLDAASRACVRPGAHIDATCVISGDAVLSNLAPHASFDERHMLLLLSQAARRRDPSRMGGNLAGGTARRIDAAGRVCEETPLEQWIRSDKEGWDGETPPRIARLAQDVELACGERFARGRCCLLLGNGSVALADTVPSQEKGRSIVRTLTILLHAEAEERRVPGDVAGWLSFLADQGLRDEDGMRELFLALAPDCTLRTVGSVAAVLGGRGAPAPGAVTHPWLICARIKDFSTSIGVPVVKEENGVLWAWKGPMGLTVQLDADGRIASATFRVRPAGKGVVPTSDWTGA